MKKTATLSLILVPILIAGCGYDVPDEVQRDVYLNKEDCAKDWSDNDLCTEMSDQDSSSYVSTHGGSGSGAHYFWGPNYHPGLRSVEYNGRTVSPTMNSGLAKPFAVSSRSTSTARTSPGRAVSRGGFGGGGHSSFGG